MRKTTISSYGITLAEARTYLRVDNTNEDTLINSLITASYSQCVNETGQDFVETAYTQSFVSSSGDLFLTIQDVSDVSTGSVVLSHGATYVYMDSVYTGNISYKTAVSGSVPETVKVAQLMLVSQWFDQRQNQVIGASVSSLDFAVSALLSSYKIVNSQ